MRARAEDEDAVCIQMKLVYDEEGSTAQGLLTYFTGALPRYGGLEVS